jgi:tetratricopeptide (TPR) repeat protein
MAPALVVALGFGVARLMREGKQASAQNNVARSVRHYQAGRYQDAIEAAKMALMQDPGSADAFNNLAVAHLRLGAWAEATQSALAAIRLRPDHRLARNNLVWILEEEAKATQRPAVTGSADTPEYFLSLSLQQWQRGRFPQSLLAAQVALRLRPDYAEALNNIAAANASMGRWDDAIEAAKRAIQIHPDFQLAKNNLAWAEAQKKAQVGKKH